MAWIERLQSLFMGSEPGRRGPALLLCAALLASGRAGAEAQITFWHNTPAVALMQDIGRSFSEQQGVAVKVNAIDGNVYKPELVKAAAQGEAPDVALLPADFLAMDAELKFSEIPPQAQNKDVLKQARQTGMLGARALGAPVYWGNHLLLYYNRDLVAQPAASFEELERQAPGLRARGVTPLGMNFGEMYSFVPFMSAFGGWPLDEQGNPTLGTPATVQALDFLFGLTAKGLVPKDCRDNCGHTRFGQGQFAYLIAGDWMDRQLSERLGARLGVALLPSIGKRPMTPMFSAYVLAFPMDSLQGPKREPLLKFVAFMQSPATQKRLAQEARLFPVHARTFKTRADSGDARVSLEQLSRARLMPNHRNMAFAWEGMAKGFSAMDNGRANAQQAAAIMQKSTENSIARAAR